MKKSKMIALSAVSSAVTVVVLILGAYFEVFRLSAIFIAGIVVMLPLAKNSAWAGLMTVLSSSVLGLFLTGFRFQIVLPYLLFFGLHPIANYVEQKKNINRYIAFVIKDVWFVLTLLLMQLFAELIAVDIEIIKKYIILIIVVGGALAFIVYDFIIKRFQKYVNLIIERIKL